jgi:hypothetical protein
MVTFTARLLSRLTRSNPSKNRSNKFHPTATAKFEQRGQSNHRVPAPLALDYVFQPNRPARR